MEKTLSKEQIRRIDNRGGDLLSMFEYGKYNKATKQRIKDYLNRPKGPCPNEGGNGFA